MRLRHLISLSCLLLLTGQRAGAQLAPADDFFHSGARYYISNSIPQAKEVVEQGLKMYPDDEKLKKLEALLNQQKQQNQQDQSQQQQSQQQKSDEQKQQDQKNSQDQQKQNQADQKKDEQQKQADQQKAAEAQDKKDESQPAKPGEMTPEEAKRLLDAQKDGEQLLQFTPPEKPRDDSHPVKDW